MFMLWSLRNSLNPRANDNDSMEINSNCNGKEPFDSFFSLLHWIQFCKNGMGLLKCDINNLTFKVLFHKSFRLDEVITKYTTNCEIYDVAMYSKEDYNMWHVQMQKIPSQFNLFFITMIP
jgi:hypothetical protein